MHFSASSLLAVTLSTGLAAAAKTSRTFAVNHFYGNGPLVMARMDPIVNPGIESAHVHAIQGGSNFAVSLADDGLIGSRCTSSLIKNDNSAYWTPSLWFDWGNGSYTSVPMFYMNVYYFFEPTDDKIEAFPVGLHMVVGNVSARTPPHTASNVLDHAQGEIQPVQFTCPRSSTSQPLYPPNSDGMHGVGIQDPNNSGAGVGFPDQNCDGYASPLRADIHFPSCYNPAAGLDNYKENMDWPTNNNCPPGWIHTPHIFYEVYWNTPLFAEYWTPGQSKQPFLLSNGDVTGYSLHADFFGGWDVPTLQQIIDNCDAGDSGMDKCPGLIGGVNDPSTSCNIPNPFSDAVTGTLDKLPGNNPVLPWGSPAAAPAPAPAAPSSSSTKVASAPSSTKVASAPSSSAAAKPQSTSLVVKPVAPSSSKPVVAAPPTSKAATQSSVIAKPPSAPSSSAAAAKPPSTTVTEPLATIDRTSTSTAHITTTTVSYTTIKQNNAAPSASAIAGSTYYGCWSDKVEPAPRALSGITFANLGDHQVTSTKCVEYCTAKGYAFAGTEYAGQCFCGNELSGSTQIDESKCNMPCEGDASEICGGPNALSVYKAANASKRRHLGRHRRSM
ncbi:hypothetical protein F5884DRAFT_660888 [Xylogone sp. PMI_703]|nr:hypothetical protein F5884DRAFT_660888 [Xylogone sp. PMI_703]